MTYGSVYLRDPIDNKPCWYDWCCYSEFLKRYASSYDTGRFLFVLD